MPVNVRISIELSIGRNLSVDKPVRDNLISLQWKQIKKIDWKNNMITSCLAIIWLIYSFTKKPMVKFKTMKQKMFVLPALLFFSIAGWSQTLFTYGNHGVSAKEFLKAYNKNNTNTGDKARSIKEYLDLYIRSHLKIQEAYDRGYDTLPQIKSEVENLRTQIIDNYINDPETMDKLVKEAFQRSQKDIHVAHIFISFRQPDGSLDSSAAKRKAEEVMTRLQKGEDFLKLAQNYSDDPSAKTNRGDIGFITVFSLPYDIENLAYTTPVGKYSALWKSNAGYHIIKNLGQRKAIGKIKAQQILLAFPPGADDATKKAIAAKADSLYRRLLKGDDMAKLATQFSNDYISANSGGIMPNFGVGQYDPAFEKYVLSLPKDGVVGKPFLSTYGYHLIKRNGIIPVVTDTADKNNMLLLRSTVEQNDRMAVSKRALYDKVLQNAGFRKMPYNDNELYQLTDSLTDFTPITVPLHINRNSVLFSIGKKTVDVNDWISYAQTFRYKADGSGRKPYSEVMDEFVHQQAEQYYREHLEQFNEEFRSQMQEFRDGNLFFEIMQREIWTKAQNDTTALKAYFEKNRHRYTWNKSADAVVFFCSDVNTSELAYKQISKNPAAWHTTADALSEKVVADSARYEWAQIPNNAQEPLHAGMVTKPVVNKGDNTASFAYIIKLYPQEELRSFEQARGLVINDYQNELDEKWIEELKKKYPVKVNEKVLESLLK
jgi:peptidyl-prolyl cis-trans isomerase SurA